MRYLTIYTDGSCMRNPGGAGGWAAIIIGDGPNIILTGGDPESTNNRMELMAVIAALESLAEPRNIRLLTDSMYVKWGVDSNGYARKPKRKNPDLWERYVKAAQGHTIKCIWVKGHNGDYWNEQADALANEQAEKHQGQLEAAGVPWERFEAF